MSQRKPQRQQTQPRRRKPKRQSERKQHFIFKIPRGVRVTRWHVQANDGEGY